ncbi:hypothetical protein L210DRAFT_2590108 [Boletus edulis BED1]|uniref:Uncharacterized protein n=1 Tax=Boletus edulis BED1 TaxID=1328754 RepID=A0AAD4BBP5_BOLED|nr:hypothetical protein L210DRAFT_2590108 [Boletus edulis BED1]
MAESASVDDAVDPATLILFGRILSMVSLDSNSSEYKKARRQHWKSTKNRQVDVDTSWSPFRSAEKKYKASFRPMSDRMVSMNKTEESDEDTFKRSPFTTMSTRYLAHCYTSFSVSQWTTGTLNHRADQESMI